MSSSVGTIPDHHVQINTTTIDRHTPSWVHQESNVFACGGRLFANDSCANNRYSVAQHYRCTSSKTAIYPYSITYKHWRENVANPARFSFATTTKCIILYRYCMYSMTITTSINLGVRLFYDAGPQLRLVYHQVPQQFSNSRAWYFPKRTAVCESS